MVSTRPGANYLVVGGSERPGPPLPDDGDPPVERTSGHRGAGRRIAPVQAVNPTDLSLGGLPGVVAPASAATPRPASPVCGPPGAPWACGSHRGGGRSGNRSADRPTCDRSSPARGPDRAGFPCGSRRPEAWHSNRPRREPQGGGHRGNGSGSRPACPHPSPHPMPCRAKHKGAGTSRAPAGRGDGRNGRNGERALPPATRLITGMEDASKRHPARRASRPSPV